MNKITLFILGIMLGFTDSHSQDTVFVRSYEPPEKINNIDGDGTRLLVRTQNHLYLFKNEEFIEVKDINLEDSRFTWISNIQNNQNDNIATYNTLIAPENKPNYKSDGSKSQILPGYYKNYIWEVRIGNKLYYNFRGKLLEYVINNFYTLTFKGASIRHIYEDDSLRIISSYSGIFVDTAKNYQVTAAKAPKYSSGEASKILGEYYLCTDELYKYKKPDWQKVLNIRHSQPLRELIQVDTSVFYLRYYSFGRMDMKNYRFIDTILANKKELTDCQEYNGNIFISSEDGSLFVFSNGKISVAVKIGFAIFDIEPDTKRLLLSTGNGLYAYYPQEKKLIKLVSHENIVQALPVIKDAYIFTTFDGLYLLKGDNLYTVIENVEFNKRALSKFDEYTIFAGSIEGLFVIDMDLLMNEYLPSLTPAKLEIKSNRWIWWTLSILTIALSTLLYLLLKNRKSKKIVEIELIKKEKITPEKIRELMLANSDIVSVKHLADNLNTSTVQLNRVLSKYNTGGLELMKEIKKEIVLKMIEEKKSPQEISNRVGYSINYIKRNFLKG